MVVVGYGQIIPQAILDIPPQGIINVHASLLPKYRGAAPIQWAIARGETRTGVTTMRIDAGLDTGDMLLKWETEIGPEETAVESGRAAGGGGRGPAGADAGRAGRHSSRTAGRRAGHLRADSEEGRRHDRLAHAGARDLEPHARLRCRGRAATASLRGQTFHIWKAASNGEPEACRRARCRSIDKKLYAGCGEGESIELLEVQLEGKKRMPAAAFLNGFTLTRGRGSGMSLPTRISISPRRTREFARSPRTIWR